MTQLYQYQQEGVQLIEHFDGRVLLADEQGLGKTIQALEYLRRHKELQPAIIVCPASVKYVWEDQAKEHCNLRTIICQGQKPPRKPLMNPGRSIYVINYDILLYWSRYLRNLHPQVVIFDEVHKLKSRGAQRTRGARMLCSPMRRVPVAKLWRSGRETSDEQHHVREDDAVWFQDKNNTVINGFVMSVSNGVASVKCQVPHLMGLSGTPLTNRPSELWSTLNLIWPQVFPAFTPFAWKYCDPQLTPYGWKYSGATNLDVLHRKLQRIGMIRRLKKDVLKDLPKKRRFVVPLDIDNRPEYNHARIDFINWLKRKDAAKAARASKAEAITKMAYLKRLAAEGKLREVYDWIDSFLEETDDKLVIACVHHSIIDALHDRYRKISVTFTGKTPGRGRRAAIAEFRNNRKTRLLIGQIQAVGLGVDGLQQVSCTSAVIELPWDPGTLSQFDDRIHRIGQTRAVSIYYLVARDTLEESLCKLIQTKQDVLTRTLDGENRLSRMKIDIYDKLERELLKGVKQ